MCWLSADEENDKSAGVKPKKSHKKKKEQYLDRVLSGQESTDTASRRKRRDRNRTPAKPGTPKRPLVCVPCKKRFVSRSKLDIHNRHEHNLDVRYSCEACHKSFSRRDHVARHVRAGHCPGHPRESTTKSDDTLAELSTTSVCLYHLHARPSTAVCVRACVRVCFITCMPGHPLLCVCVCVCASSLACLAIHCCSSVLCLLKDK